MTKPKKKFHRWQDVRARKMSPERVERLDKEVAAELLDMDLRAVRELLGKTQTELAEAIGATQGELSRLERREDHRLSTLRRYVEGLGGCLEVTARFGDKSVRLHGV